MASTNQSPQYQKAESMFLEAKTNEEKLRWLEEMIKECPKHKSSEKMLANLKQRYIKLKEKINAERKSKKGSKIGIKKESMQAVIIGKTGTGKSSLLSALTNVHPKISYEGAKFTTKNLIVGTMFYADISIQLIENPAIESEFYDKGIANTADVILMLITNINQIEELEKALGKNRGKKLVIFNKIDLLTENEKRKIQATLQSKKYNFILFSAKTKENLEGLRNKIFESFDKLRIYTKQPGEKFDRAKSFPMILEMGSDVKDVAEKILKGFSSRIKETRIWGPSSKFAGQIVGLKHKLKDLDVVEFKTR